MIELDYILYRLRQIDWQYQSGRLCAAFIFVAYILMVSYASTAIHEFTHLYQLQQFNAENGIQINVTEICLIGNMPDRSANNAMPYFEDVSLEKVLLDNSASGWVEYDYEYPVTWVVGINSRELAAVVVQVLFMVLMMVPWRAVLWPP